MGAERARPHPSMSIGQLAALTGVSSRTIRYYEELGILPPPPRTAGGTRKYPGVYRYYVEGALALKEMGFTLDEIRLLGAAALGMPLSARQRARRGPRQGARLRAEGADAQPAA
jgi:DNA-binding transcriptional MerR regulator